MARSFKVLEQGHVLEGAGPQLRPQILGFLLLEMTIKKGKEEMKQAKLHTQTRILYFIHNLHYLQGRQTALFFQHHRHRGVA